MKTFQQRWDEVKVDADRVNRWLDNLWLTKENMAWQLTSISTRFDPKLPSARAIMKQFACQDETHAEWINGLIDARGAAVVGYYDMFPVGQFISGADDPRVQLARSYLVEVGMIDRLVTIAEDPDSPADVRHLADLVVSDMQWRERGYMSLTDMSTVNAQRQACIEMFDLLDAKLDNAE